MAKGKPVTDPTIDSMLEAYNAILSATLTYCVGSAGPETAYLTIGRMIEEMQKQQETIKQAWIQIRQEELAESESTTA